eukprot:6198934-Pleurochrysis_carterae.AAC.3
MRSESRRIGCNGSGRRPAQTAGRIASARCERNATFGQQWNMEPGYKSGGRCAAAPPRRRGSGQIRWVQMGRIQSECVCVRRCL